MTKVALLTCAHFAVGRGRRVGDVVDCEPCRDQRTVVAIIPPTRPGNPS
jgi:hypothetical protein